MEIRTVDDGVAAFLLHRQDKGVSDGSIALYRYWLTLWSDWRARQGHDAALAAITAGELRAFFRYLEHEHIPHTGNKRRPAARQVGMKAQSRDGAWRVLRAFWNFLMDEGAIHATQAGFFRRDRVPRPRLGTADEDGDSAIASDRAISLHTLKRLLRECGGPFTELAARNRAILLLLYESGVRVSELCSINDNSIDTENRTAKIRAKGNTWRFVFWGPDTADALGRYLVMREGERGGKRPFFRGLSSTNAGERLTTNAVRGMIKRLARDADVELPLGAPIHGFRSGFAQRCLDEGMADLDLQQLLGHTDIRTTAVYTKRHPRKLRDVHRRIFDKPVIGRHLKKRSIS